MNRTGESDGGIETDSAVERQVVSSTFRRAKCCFGEVTLQIVTQIPPIRGELDKSDGRTNAS